MPNSAVDRSREARGITRGTIAGGLLGALFVAVIAGPQLLDPTRIAWAMKSDWVNHFFGWHYFRIEPWHWPPGTIHGYRAPIGSSIGMTDSIPLAAYVFKPFASWLPATFQYLSLWWVLCFALQGALGARLVSRVSTSASVQVLGGLLFVSLPTLLARVGHAALCSHWLLLWALLLATRDGPARHRAWEWAALGLIAGLIHPYLAAMTLALLVAVATAPTGASPGRRLAALSAAVAATTLGWWLSGLFILQSAAQLQFEGLGEYSSNLLAPVMPQGWSRWLPEVPVEHDGQRYEGFHYVGAGVLALTVVALAIVAQRRTSVRATARLGWPVVIVCLAMAVFALSPKVTAGSAVVVDLSSPVWAPLSVFRATGRFTWPVTYVLLTAVLFAIVQRTSARTATTLLALGLGVQLWDLHGAHRERFHTARSDAFLTWANPLPSPEWHTLLARHTDLALVPPTHCGVGPVNYDAVLYLAALHGLTANVGTVSRRDPQADRAYCTTLGATITAGTLEPRTIYLMGDAYAQALNSLPAARGRCRPIDGVWACGVSIAAPTP